MKFIFVSMEKDLMSVEPKILKSSILIRFLENQLSVGDLKFVIITLNLVKSQILLKLIEFCKFKYFKYKVSSLDYKTDKDFFYGQWNFFDLHVEQWYKNFITISIISLFDLLVLGYILGIEELIDLSLHGISIVLVKKVNVKNPL